MAEYKRIPYKLVEHTEIARKCYLTYERNQDLPDKAETEAGWIADLKKLRWALDQLTQRQREIYIMKVGHRMKEDKIASRLHISQAAVSQGYSAAKKKLAKTIGKITDK